MSSVGNGGAAAGRSVGLSLGALVVGILLGAGLNAWLRVDIVPIGVSDVKECTCACHSFCMCSVMLEAT